ncbi:MAG TPA: hypothetical protein VM639_08435 [Dongiaceae bacterium]|nr:hypothetical protein [Dongiaceae bacterium]
MTANGSSTGTPVASGAGASHGGHPAAPVASALQSRIGHLPQMTFRQAGIRNPSLPTLLSLFFLLLAFFIVLNSLSQRDAGKQSSVTASIDQTFGGPSNADPLSAAQNAQQSTTGILRGLASYFGVLLPADRQKILISANQLTMRLPTELFFKLGPDGAITSQQADQAPAILRQIGEALDKRPADWGCEVHIELAAPSPGQLDVERAGQLAVVLSRTASQRRNDLSVGLNTGDARWLTIAIRLRPPEMPDLPGQRKSGRETPNDRAGAAPRVAP